MEPLRTWKELFLGERAFKHRKPSRDRRRFANNGFAVNTVHASVGE